MAALRGRQGERTASSPLGSFRRLSAVRGPSHFGEVSPHSCGPVATTLGEPPGLARRYQATQGAAQRTLPMGAQRQAERPAGPTTAPHGSVGVGTGSVEWWRGRVVWGGLVPSACHTASRECDPYAPLQAEH